MPGTRLGDGAIGADVGADMAAGAPPSSGTVVCAGFARAATLAGAACAEAFTGLACFLFFFVASFIVLADFLAIFFSLTVFLAILCRFGAVETIAGGGSGLGGTKAGGGASGSAAKGATAGDAAGSGLFEEQAASTVNKAAMSNGRADLSTFFLPGLGGPIPTGMGIAPGE